MTHQITLTALLIFALAPLAFAQNYNNGNGTILSEETWGNLKVVRRRHVQTVTMAENLDIAEKTRRSGLILPICMRQNMHWCRNGANRRLSTIAQAR